MEFSICIEPLTNEEITQWTGRPAPSRRQQQRTMQKPTPKGEWPWKKAGRRRVDLGAHGKRVMCWQ